MFLHFRLLASELSKSLQPFSRTKQLHVLVVKLRLSDDAFFATNIARLYGMNYELDCARKVFDGCGSRSVFLWNSMIRAYARVCSFDEAFSVFRSMLGSETRPDSFSYACVVRACCEAGYVDGLKLFHGGIVVSGLARDLICNSALVTAYSKLGLIKEATRAFGAISEPDLVMWNSMISGYSSCGLWEGGFGMFAAMRGTGIRPDGFSLVGLISSLVGPDLIRFGEGLHGFCLKTGFESNHHVGSTLVKMYSRYERMDSAWEVFRSLVDVDLVAWSALISGYSRCGEYEKAISLFRKMMRIKGRKVDPILTATVLSAVAQSADARPGAEIHGHVLRCGLKSDVMILSALVDMYSKCGMLGLAKGVFENMPEKNAVSYNSMIQGLGLHGLASESFEVLGRMLAAGIKPDDCTLAAILCACCHAGLVEEGRDVFVRMEDEFHICPKAVHYVHMVKLLGMAGELEEVYRLVNSSTEPIDPGIWGALLSCCEAHGNSELAEIAAGKLVASEADKVSCRVMLSKVYASDGRWNEANELRDQMTVRRLRKMPGLSWIGGSPFSSGDGSCSKTSDGTEPMSEQIDRIVN